MSIAMVVFIVFPFNSLRPVARLRQEAVDKAVERSESRGAADEDQAHATRVANVWVRDGRRLDWPVGMAAALVLVETMFILALLDATPVKL